MFLCALQAAAQNTPLISIIIDDLGNRGAADRRAVELPGPVACSFLPLRPHTTRLARQAWMLDKEVLLHLPMESEQSGDPGDGSLTLDMNREQFTLALGRALDAVPHVSGVNNHMGSLLTRLPLQMTWLMKDLQDRGDLFFVDSRTTPRTVARRVALETGVPSLERNVFLDNDRDSPAVVEAFDRLLDMARRDGFAVAIGHPHDSTLELLETRLPLLESEGVRLVSLGEMIRQQESQQWSASSSPSPKVSKNSKP